MTIGEELQEMGFDDAVYFPDFNDECIIGIDINGRVIYSYEKMIDSLIEEGTDDIEAIEWLEYYLKTYKKGKKQDFIRLLDDKLPDTLDDKQKQSKVKNLLQTLKNENMITTDNPNKRLANWILVKR